jgi:hypothetical protein
MPMTMGECSRLIAAQQGYRTPLANEFDDEELDEFTKGSIR